jgi:hypothetical protein
VGGEEDDSIADGVHERWEGVRRLGRQTKQQWRCLTMDEVDGGFAGAARTRAVGSGGVASDRAVGTGRPVDVLWHGRVRGSAAAAHGARWRWSSNTWAPTQTIDTDRWDPAAELFLN